MAFSTQLRNPLQSVNFECACPSINLTIYNGLEGASGGQEILEADEESKGAVTVTNWNDTDGDGLQDNFDFNVSATSVGRDEVDLMRLVIELDGVVDLSCGEQLELVLSEKIKLWDSPTKGVQIVDLNFDVLDLPITVYIEACDYSDALRDLYAEVIYNGISQDIVKATAVWVEKTSMPGHWANPTSTPVPQSAELPNVGDFNTFAINQNIADNGTRYGHGDSHKNVVNAPPNYVDMSDDDKKFGGRILMEWKVFPVDAETLVSFDVTRQRKTKTWFINYGEIDFEESGESTDFPFESFGDVEEPNDDGNGSSEDRNPENSFLYSWDHPNIWKVLPAQQSRAFHVSKNWFKEFVRVRPLASPFDNDDGSLQGSRSSDKFDWHCVFYARRDADYELSIDEVLASHSHLKSDQLNVNEYFNVTSNADNVSYEVGTFSIVYKGVNGNGEKELVICRFDGTNNIEQTFTIPTSETTWSINFEAVQLTLEEIATIPNNSIIEFNTFKTNAGSKDNIVGNGNYQNFVR